jgi:hypothetical protein
MIGILAPLAIGSPLSSTMRVEGNVSGAALEHTAPAEGAPPMEVSRHAIGNALSITICDTSSSIRNWSPYVNTIFQQLVAKRAEGNLSPEERKKLDRLRAARDRLAASIPADQVLRDFKTRQLRREALAAMQKYADFIEKSASNKKA